MARLNPVIQKRGRNASASLQDVMAHDRLSGKGSVCSTHPWVIDAAIQQAMEDDSFLPVQSSSSQVNQLGGYSGKTPSLGPFPWRTKAANRALRKARELARACVLAGGRKIHLDASMACADDGKVLPEQMVAQRAALVCQAAEEALQDWPTGVDLPVYVIGTEVPAPGGESAQGTPLAGTTIESLHRTLKIFEQAFEDRGLSAAWQRVIGVVVQRGEEFGDDVVFECDRTRARPLSAGLPCSPSSIRSALHRLSVSRRSGSNGPRPLRYSESGPMVELRISESCVRFDRDRTRTLAEEKNQRLSELREALDRAMLRDPAFWSFYYKGDESQRRSSRAYSDSHRCRYHWHEILVRAEIERLLGNLTARPVPLTLVSQHLPFEYAVNENGANRESAGGDHP